MGSLDKHNPPAPVVIGTADGQYRIEDPFTPLVEPWPNTPDGLTTGEDGWMAVLTGIEWGPLNVTIQLLPDAPPEVATGWDTVSQRSLRATSTTLDIANTSLNQLHTIDLPAPGWYMVRVHARGRISRLAKHHHPDGQEEHLVQLWPIPEREPEATLTGPDEYGRFFLK